MVVMACHAVTAMCNAEAAYCGHLRRVSRRQLMFTRLMMMVMMVMRAGVWSSTNTRSYPDTSHFPIQLMIVPPVLPMLLLPMLMLRLLLLNDMEVCT